MLNRMNMVFHIFRLLFRLKENKATGTWQNKEVDMCNSKVCQYPLKSTFTGHMTSFGLDEEGNTHHAGMSTCVTLAPVCHPYTFKNRIYRAQLCGSNEYPLSLFEQKQNIREKYIHTCSPVATFFFIIELDLDCVL